jgi:hypothetical protein
MSRFYLDIDKLKRGGLSTILKSCLFIARLSGKINANIRYTVNGLSLEIRFWEGSTNKRGEHLIFEK